MGKGLRTGRTKDQTKQEERFFRCPKGHLLPHKTDLGSCTPVWCPGNRAVRNKKDQKAVQAALAKPEKVLPALKTEDGIKEEIKLEKAKGRREARLKAVEFPEKAMEGTEAEEWADKEVVRLLPEAVAHIKYQLRYGDDEAKDKAADKILAATGRSKREGGAGTGSVFQFIMAPGTQPGVTPWMQRVEPSKLPGDDK